MSAAWARFFSRVQAAGFYSELHRSAVELLPAGEGKSWFDVGTGPGLVARLAGARGYQATGFDLDPAMVAAANANLRRQPANAHFEVCGLEELAASGRKADVVSAASLLAVLKDREGALRRLLACVNEGGALVLVETTARMKPSAALAWLRKNGMRRGNWLLMIWARARARGTAFQPALPPGYQAEHTDLLAGLVSAWVIRRSPAR